MKNIIIAFLIALMMAWVFADGMQIDTPIFPDDSRFVVPGDYYNSACPIPKWMPVKMWLTMMVWRAPYELNGWDCSQMAAYTEWAMENCGYDTQIAVSESHAWVIIDIRGEKCGYECTSRHIRNTEKYLDPLAIFENLYDILFQYLGGRMSKTEALESFNREWGWWLE
jgi:hypothetical protein